MKNARENYLKYLETQDKKFKERYKKSQFNLNRLLNDVYVIDENFGANAFSEKLTEN